MARTRRTQVPPLRLILDSGAVIGLSRNESAPVPHLLLRMKRVRWFRCHRLLLPRRYGAQREMPGSIASSRRSAMFQRQTRRPLDLLEVCWALRT